MKLSLSLMAVLLLLIMISCKEKLPPNEAMWTLLSDVAKYEYNPNNPFDPAARLAYYDSSLKTSRGKADPFPMQYLMVKTLLELGDEEQSLALCHELMKSSYGKDFMKKKALLKNLGIAYLRLGERKNCIYQHSGESCIFPIAGRGIHHDPHGSEKAIEVFKEILQSDPDDLESRWLLNLAYMTIAGYPHRVPPSLLIPGLDAPSSIPVKPFTDVAMQTRLNEKDMAGGSIIDDFNNDGYLDLITSSWSLNEPMHYCINNGNGTFTDASIVSNIQKFTGGLNIMQTDYNNDGWKDIFVLRGAWKREFGKEPASLLRNNGDGTFTDVTVESGLLRFRPTQTATWADFNNDSWLDVFIGNESTSQVDLNPCELFINNGDGTFTEMAAKAGCQVEAFVKGVTSGDFDNDGRTDLFLSTLNGPKILFRNEGMVNGQLHFTDITERAGLANNLTRTFPTWFWDYNNDGWLDLMVAGYDFERSLGWHAAAEALGESQGSTGKILLFRNKQDGTFEEVSDAAGLDRLVFAMGANFGDLDNDGYLDMYFGTGNPLYQSLVPNKLFKNIDGQHFADITSTARVGSLQKGHGVSWADLDNDGDQDIYIEMGGAYKGDAYENALFINPGQNNNRWINISLEGTTCNKPAIGARLKITFTENGRTRSVYRDVNSGGSFGSNPLLQHVGIGQASTIQSLEIKWPGSNTPQLFYNLPANTNIRIRQGNSAYATVVLNTVDFTLAGNKVIGCSPF